MKNNLKYISGIALTATMLMASCASEPLAGPDTGELYTRQFIKDFGVPAAGHDFSMATSAGLQVKASRPTSVVVTAVVDGKEYLFANLTVGEGTTELPVTIPRSVSQLNIKTPAGQITAGVNDIVDLDAIKLPASRSVDFTINNNGQYIFQSDYSDQPVITFKVSDFLKKFFEDNPQGQPNTNYWYMGKDMGTGKYDARLGGPSDICNYSETVIGDHSALGDYYVFPIYWRRNKAGYKNYALMMFNWPTAIFPGVNFAMESLFDPSKITSAIPFPQLYYSEESIEPADVYTDFESKFKTDDGTFDQSYPINDDGTVVSYGTRLRLTETPCALEFALISGTDGNTLYSHSSPVWNSIFWGDNYYDETLSNLMFSFASTKIYPVGEIGQGNANWQDFNIIPDSSTGSTEFKTLSKSNPFILGFDTPALKPAADGSTRDYSDVLLLFIPMNPIEYYYCWEELPEPYDWVVACEDLGGSFDWDFNDAVFTFTDVIESLGSVNKNNTLTYLVTPADAENVRKITVKPLAAGGTLPLYITYTGLNVGQYPDMPSEGDMMYSEANSKVKDAVMAATGNYYKTYIVGTELHKWLGGATHETPINVGAKHAERGAEEVHLMVPTTYSHTAKPLHHGVSAENTPIGGGFALLVDKDNTLGIDARNDVDKGFVHMPDHLIGYTYFIGAPNENKGDVAPQMIVVPGDWEWPREMVNIKDAYPGFYDWLANPEDHDWFRNNPNRGNVTAR